MVRSVSQMSTASYSNHASPEVYDNETDAIYGMIVQAPVEPDVTNYENEQDHNDLYNGMEQLYGQIDQPKSKRDYIIAEIYDTEKRYVEQLENMVTYFVGPLRRVLTPDEMTDIFINLETLTEMHKKFFTDLEKVAKTKHEQRRISVPFRAFQDKLSNYAEFLLGIDHSQIILDNVMANVAQAKEIIEAGKQKATEHKFKLTELIKVRKRALLPRDNVQFD